MGHIGIPELLIILLIFGGAKLPKLARSLGQAQREFKEGVVEGDTSAPADTGTPPAPPKTEGNGIA